MHKRIIFPNRSNSYLQFKGDAIAKKRGEIQLFAATKKKHSLTNSDHIDFSQFQLNTTLKTIEFNDMNRVTQSVYEL